MASDEFLRATLENYRASEKAKDEPERRLQESRDAATARAHAAMAGPVAEVLWSADRQLKEAGFWCGAIAEPTKATLVLDPGSGSDRGHSELRFRIDVEGDINVVADFPGERQVPQGEISTEGRVLEQVREKVKVFVATVLAKV